jgi:large conductance mechanosensitive channel
MLKEFKEFALKGNMLDLAVGIMLGAAFGAVVNSLVADLVTPLIGLLTGGQDFANSFVVLRAGKVAGPYASLKLARDAGAVVLSWGVFVNALLNFLLVALVLFFVVKAMNQWRRRASEPAAAPAEPSAEAKLLTEIRDLLREGRG